MFKFLLEQCFTLLMNKKAALSFTCSVFFIFNTISGTGTCQFPSTRWSFLLTIVLSLSRQIGKLQLVDFSPNSTYLDLEMSCSTSSSILNTTNSNGATVYGAVPSNPTPSVAARINETPHFMSVTFLIVFLAQLTSSLC
jgi:hypothetical protein